MKIGELTKKFGVSCRQIRHYEELGLLTSSREDSSNYRIYDQSACDRLEIIKLLRDLGFSLKEVKQVLDSPHDDETQKLFVRKSVELDNELSALSNRAQILRAAANMLNEHGLMTNSLAAIIKECVYIHSKNERVIPMTNDKVLIEVGIGLLPICEDGENSPLVCGVKKFRQDMEKELNVNIPLFRIRDNTKMAEFALSISIDGKNVCQRTYAACQGGETVNDVLSLLSSCVKENPELFV